MRKTVFRYFYGFLGAQQRFLNRMAAQGWRLVRTGRITYEFESCTSGAYQYCVEFVAQKSPEASKDYQMFLEELGYRVMTKPININYSLGKVRIRPWGEGWGKIATTPGAFNKELLIVEKENDGQPFELHTTSEDRIRYYHTLRSAWTVLSLTLVGFLVFFIWRAEPLWKTVALGVVTVIHLWIAIQSHRILRKLKMEGEVIE